MTSNPFDFAPPLGAAALRSPVRAEPGETHPDMSGGAVSAANDPALTEYGSGSGQGMSGRKPLLIAALAVLAVAVAAIGLATRSSVPKLAVVTARPAVIQSQPGGVGLTDVPISQQVAISTGTLSITTPLQVTAVDVAPGTRVKAGQPILSLDPTPLKANMTLYTTELTQAKQALAQAQQVLAQLPATSGYLSQRLAQQSAIQADTSRISLATEVLALAQGDSPTVTAPISGTVSSVTVTPGQTVAAKQTLITILDVSQLSVSASIPLVDLPVVTPGEKATVTFPNLPSVALTGHLVAVSPEASGGGQYGTVLVTAANSTTAPVPLGIQAFVSIQAPRQAAVSVPRLAVSNATTAPAVYVVSGGRVQRVAVTLGAQDDNRVEILSGLQAGMQVAIAGTQSVTNGEKVRTVSSSQ